MLYIKSTMSIGSSIECFRTGDGEPSLCLHQLHILASIEDGRSIIDSITEAGIYGKLQDAVSNLKKCCATCKLDDMEDMLIELFRYYHGYIKEINLTSFLSETGLSLEATYAKFQELMTYYLSNKLMILDETDDGNELRKDVVEKLRDGKSKLDSTLSLYALSKFKKYNETKELVRQKAELCINTAMSYPQAAAKMVKTTSLFTEEVIEDALEGCQEFIEDILEGDQSCCKCSDDVPDEAVLSGCMTILKNVSDDTGDIAECFVEKVEVKPKPVLIPLSVKPRFTYTRAELEYLWQYVESIVDTHDGNVSDTAVYRQVMRDLPESRAKGYDEYVLSKRRFEPIN